MVIPTGQSIPAAVHMKNRPTISNCCRDTLTCRDHHVVNPCFLYSGEILPCTFGSLRAIVCTLLSLYPAFSQCRSNGRYFLVLQRRAVIGVHGRTTNAVPRSLSLDLEYQIELDGLRLRGSFRVLSPWVSVLFSISLATFWAS